MFMGLCLMVHSQISKLLLSCRCNLDVGEMKTWFQHPQAPGSCVYVISNVCHMIKLVRNLFDDFKTIQLQSDGELRLIQWCFLEDLNAVQEMLGFSFANKLEKEAHHMAEAQDACQLSCANTEHLCG